MLMRLLAITASAALLAGAAQAQTSATAGAQVAPPAGAAPATGAPVDTTGYNSQASGSASGTVTLPASSSTLGDAATLKAGDPGVVSNGPVPDTRENRAKYGKPDSSAGKHTQPAGN